MTPQEQEQLEQIVKRGVMKGALLAWVVIVLVSVILALAAFGVQSCTGLMRTG